MKKFIYMILLSITIIIGVISIVNFRKVTTAHEEKSTSKNVVVQKKEKPLTYDDRMNQQLANKINAYIRPKRDHLNVFVLNNGKTVLNETYIHMDIPGSPKLHKDDMFLVGSCNKLLTGIMIKQLEQEQKLDINAPVTKYIPEFKNKNILIKDLILHRSGLVYYNPPEKGYGIDASVNAINLAGIDVKNKNMFYYNDANYILLAKVIENITNQSYEENVNTRIIKANHLKNVAFFDDKAQQSKFVIGHSLEKNQWVQNKPNDLDKFYGAGNVYMSTEALATLTHQLATNQIFDAKTTNQLMDNLAIDVAQKYRYGFYKEQGYYRTRGYMYGQDVVCYFNQNISIVLATNKIRFEDTHINEADIKHIFEMVRMDNLNRNQTNNTTINPSLNKQSIL